MVLAIKLLAKLKICDVWNIERYTEVIKISSKYVRGLHGARFACFSVPVVLN